MLARIKNENVLLWLSGYCALPLAAVILGSLALGACAGPQRQPPMQVWPDMRNQGKYKPQMESGIFADHRTTRRPVEGTISRDSQRDDSPFYTGIENGEYIGKMPVKVTPELLATGQTKFNTYCSPCHDRAGSGEGIVAVKAPTLKPANLMEDRLKQTADGDLFTVITYGRRNMHPYRFQIVESDRWAIVAYVRALQRATSGSMNDVPEPLRGDLR